VSLCLWVKITSEINAANPVASSRGPQPVRAQKGWYFPAYLAQSDFPRLAGGTMPFIRKYSTICP
jgi:hypothetical protein